VQGGPSSRFYAGLARVWRRSCQAKELNSLPDDIDPRGRIFEGPRQARRARLAHVPELEFGESHRRHQGEAGELVSFESFEAARSSARLAFARSTQGPQTNTVRSCEFVMGAVCGSPHWGQSEPSSPSALVMFSLLYVMRSNIQSGGGAGPAFEAQGGEGEGGLTMVIKSVFYHIRQRTSINTRVYRHTVTSRRGVSVFSVSGFRL
jgi:hypothetical protein